ncbi:MAG TPA: hypothetical protein VGF89_01030 [Steroidobacteraceae bacterium]|jgi:hypothetical protein
MSRFVIRHPKGGLFTEVDIVGTVKSTESAGPDQDVVHRRHSLSPRFDGLHPSQASKFDTAEDATGLMAHPHLADAKAFEGCTVEPAT